MNTDHNSLCYDIAFSKSLSHRDLTWFIFQRYESCYWHGLFLSASESQRLDMVYFSGMSSNMELLWFISGLWSHMDFAWLISQGCGVTWTLHG